MSNKTNFITAPGSPLPLGASFYRNGAKFSIISRNAEYVKLILFYSDAPDSDFDEITLDPKIHKTGDIWHIWIEGIKEGQLYGYRIYGPYDPANGHRFNNNKLLIDPYSKALTGNYKFDLTKSWGYNSDEKNPDSELQYISFSTVDSAPYVPKSILIDEKFHNGDNPINLPYENSIIYELHIKGFTYHDSSNTNHKGTYKGVIEKIPYLKDLGINAVELMPVQEFDENESNFINPLTGEKLKNFWGYSTLSFFAPKESYSSKGKGSQVEEFREMVKEFHTAGIEVILDVVFNHTAEGDHKGPTISFKGIDNSIYYILKDDKRLYKNFSGCGNTFNCNHPLVRDFILDSLRYWVVEMNVDGFRFDLASILGRDQQGHILSNPPLIERIEQDPILRNTKIIAEAWDAAGAYQVGDFPGRWAEWNGKFRDDVRKFWRGDDNSVGKFATRITGSSDLYDDSDMGPNRGINFITCHDGFTLNDLVSYNTKHNIANGEDNRDGENHNLSYNFGTEGPPATKYIEKMRIRQIKNFLTTLFLSLGIPMLLSGDEFRRTQKGNNNSYCQDNEISWIDWNLLDKNNEIFQFTKKIIKFRKEHPILKKSHFFTGNKKKGFNEPDISWHGYNVNKPQWGKHSHSISLLINGEYALLQNDQKDSDIYIIYNASKISRHFNMPESPSGKKWKLVIDTSLPGPEDIKEPGMEQLFNDSKYHVKKMSSVVFITDTG